MTILVVDDQRINREVLRAQLEAEGHAVVDAADGNEALSVLERERVDAVISDILMPRMDGYSLCRAVRQHPRFSALPLVFYTGAYDADADRRIADAIGADGYLIRPAPAPVIVDALHGAVAKAARRPRARAAPSPDTHALQEYSAVLVQRLEDRNVELQQAIERLQQRAEERTAELERMNRELEIARTHKSRFLASMSHELRTPMNSILGFAQLLQDPDFGSLEDTQRKFIGNIHASGTHLLALINDILDLSKAVTGTIDLQREAVGVGEALDRVGKIVAPLAARKTLTLTIHPPDAGLTVLADAARVKQVLYILISNAIKFTGDRGRVEVRAVAEPGAIRFSVADNGIGVAKADQERIFDEFQQIDSAVSRQFEGTGLGLALARNLVRLHGGDIHVDSAPGTGSTFSFTLPRFTAAARSGAAVSVAGAADAPPIVVIADDRQRGELIAARLAGGGHVVVRAADAHQAVRDAGWRQPVAVVVDLPCMLEHGWDAVAVVSADSAAAPLPVAVVTLADDRLVGVNLRVAAVLTGPLNRSRLVAAVKRLGLTTKAKERRVSVLIVGGEAETRELATAALEPFGFQLLTGATSREALRLMAAARPDLVVVDLVLPDMNAVELIADMQGHAATADVPAIVVSAQALPRHDHERLHGQVAGLLAQRGVPAARLLTALRGSATHVFADAPIVDRVTALFNGVYFDKRLHEEVARGRRYGREFALALIAVGHLSDITAAHAHAPADLALEEFSRILEGTLRSADPIARVGGHVFGVLLPETVGAGALDAAEKVRAKVENSLFLPANGGAPARLTVSIGVACYPADGTTSEALTRAARLALGRASALDHSTVVAATPEDTGAQPAS